MSKFCKRKNKLRNSLKTNSFKLCTGKLLENFQQELTNHCTDYRNRSALPEFSWASMILFVGHFEAFCVLPKFSAHLKIIDEPIVYLKRFFFNDSINFKLHEFLLKIADYSDIWLSIFNCLAGGNCFKASVTELNYGH